MARKKQKSQVGSHAYTIRQMGAMDGLRAQALLFRALGEPIALVVGSIGSLGELLELDTEDEAGGAKILELLEQAIPALAERVDGEDLVKLAKLLVLGNVTASVDGQEIDIDDIETYEDIVGGRGPWHQLQLLRECVVVNFVPPGAGADTNLKSQEERQPAGSPQ